MGDDDRTVPTWRCAADPFELEPGDRCDASPIAPHRGVYLRLDVPRDLGDGRGRVAPIWRGTWRRVDDGVELSWSGRVTRIAWTEGGARRIR